VDFADYTRWAVDLVNADLSSLGALRMALTKRPWAAEHARASDVAALRVLQRELAAVVDMSAQHDGGAVVERINALLSKHPVRPRISGHDESTWHLHVSDRGAAVAELLAAEAAFGLALLVTEQGAERLGRCSASSCNQAFFDLTTNRTRQYCSTRCATRTNVAKFRSRKREAG
jgi:predicted RNA-binding Zn ribbon-like protein